MSLKVEYKITVLGDEGVGKHSFINSLAENLRSSVGSRHSHIGLDIIEYNFSKKIDEDLVEFFIKFLIISGQERNNEATKIIYKDINGFFIFFDVNNEETFNCINIWEDLIKENSNKKDHLIAIVGNKINNNRIIKLEDIENHIKDKNYLYYENKNGSEKEIVTTFIEEIYKRNKNCEINTKTIQLEGVNECHKCDCCCYIF